MNEMNKGLKDADGRGAELSDEMIDEVVGGSNVYHKSVICAICGKSISNRFARFIRIDGKTLRACPSCADKMKNA